MPQAQNFQCQSTSDIQNENMSVSYIKEAQSQNTESENHQNFFILLYSPSQ